MDVTWNYPLPYGDDHKVYGGVRRFDEHNLEKNMLVKTPPDQEEYKQCDPIGLTSITWKKKCS